MSRSGLRWLALAGMLVMAGVILWATLTPSPPHLPTVAKLTATATGTPPAPQVPTEWSAEDEEALGHSMLFAGMAAFAALWVATGSGRRPPWQGLLVALLALWLFGAATEGAQGFTPTRSPSLSDWGWDAIGATLGLTLGWLASRALLGLAARR